jgi:serine/threonine-protein kinase TTK/MPS1
MIYGKPPYGDYPAAKRMLAIMNPDVQIEYPKYGLGNVRVPRTAIETIQGCLVRSPTDRWTIDNALHGAFLSPQTVDRAFIKDLVDHAVEYGATRSEKLPREELEWIANDVWKKLQAMNPVISPE